MYTKAFVDWIFNEQKKVFVIVDILFYAST